MNTKPFIELLLSHKDDIAWVSEHIILAVMRYQKQVKGLPKSLVDFDDTSGSFADIYADLQKHGFESQTIFKEAVYLALQRWSGHGEDDANYLMELIYLATYLAESRVAGYLMTLIRQLQPDHFTQPDAYFDVVNLSFGVIADYASDPNVGEFLKSHLINPVLSKQYAPFLSWCFMALCRQDRVNYPLYLNRLLNVARRFPDHYTDFEVELETLSESVSVQTFINQLPKVSDATLQGLYEVDKSSFKACLIRYFEMAKERTDLYGVGVNRFLDWLCKDETPTKSASYRKALTPITVEFVPLNANLGRNYPLRRRNIVGVVQREPNTAIRLTGTSFTSPSLNDLGVTVTGVTLELGESVLGENQRLANQIVSKMIDSLKTEGIILSWNQLSQANSSNPTDTETV